MQQLLRCLILILFVALAPITTPMALAYEFSPKSPAQASKQAQRWSLSQWMEQKGKLQWMDLWLNSNKNSPSFYEIYLGVDYSTMERTLFTNPTGPLLTKEDITSKSGHVGIFVSIFGLYGRYERSNDSERKSWDALTQLRIFGASDQGSNITLFYGLKDLELQLEKTQHQQAGGYLTLYVLEHWAVQGRYAQFFKDSPTSGGDLSGTRTEISSWLEWGPMRFFGTYYKEPLELNTGGITTETTFEGYSIGFRTYLDFKK